MPAETPRPAAAHPNLRLEPLAVEHLPHVMTWVNDREVMQYFANRQTHIGEEEEARYLKTLLASSNDRAFSVFDGDHYVGQCSVNAIYWPVQRPAVHRHSQGRPGPRLRPGSHPGTARYCLATA